MRSDLLIQLPRFLSDEAAAALLLKGMTAGFLCMTSTRCNAATLSWSMRRRAASASFYAAGRKRLAQPSSASTSSEAKAEQAKRVGCDHVIIASREDFADAVMRLTDGKGAQVVYDAVGKDTFEGSIRALAARGHLVSFGQASGDVGAYSDRRARKSFGHFVAPELWALYGHCGEAEIANRSAVRRAAIGHIGRRDAETLRSRRSPRRARGPRRPQNDRRTGSDYLILQSVLDSGNGDQWPDLLELRGRIAAARGVFGRDALQRAACAVRIGSRRRMFRTPLSQ